MAIAPGCRPDASLEATGVRVLYAPLRKSGRVVQASDRNSDHGSSSLPDVFGSSGDYGAMVSTRDCGPRNAGSNPSGRPVVA